MSSLIEMFAPALDEGPIGYFRRLAMRNGYDNWRGLVRTAGLNPSLNALWKNPDRLARTLGLEPQWMAALLPKSREYSGLHDPFFQRQFAEPICPECLKEAEYLRHPWTHCFATACPQHGCRLVETCPDCLTPLENLRHSIALCNCGYDLRYSTTLPATSAEIWISARLAGDMRPVHGIEELGKLDDYRLLAKLLFQLTVRYDADIQVKAGKISRPKTVSESIEFLTPVLALLEDWRPRFSAHVRRRFSAGASDTSSLSARLGAWYTNLHKLCRKTGAFPVVWEGVSNAVFENFDGVLRGQNGLSPSTGVRRRYVSFSEAATIIGISIPALRRAIDQNLVAVHVSRPGTNYQITTVPREDAEHIRRLRDEWISESEAARQLGITAPMLDNLVRAGILEYDKRWGLSFYKSGPILAKELPLLINQLLGMVKKQLADDALTFSELTARRTVDIKALDTLYQAIFSGQLCPIGHDGTIGLSGFVFSAAEVKRFLGSVALSNALTLTQLERATGWKYESLRQWVALGLLEAEQVPLQGNPTYVVSVGAIVQFRQEWMPVSEVAKAIGSKASAITARLAAKGVFIVGQTTPENGPRRGGLVRIRDLVLLAGLQG
jgi:hypothetical protein